ncbi:hypothetical protein M569_17108 [Genlisea aurea]|uniref:Senescence regulator n=1 Tax=Genlisea aurea TaxID=192259 RepID=S8BTJ3_9LAMI|nr:hypothetical protein M569_17108 [Genlisea aurea]
MAKGRKIPTSRNERYLGSLAYSHGQGTGGNSPELDEDEVWAVVDGSEAWDSRAGMDVHGGGGYRRAGGLSLAFDDSGGSASRIVHQFRRHDAAPETPRNRSMATSAPVNVPDWSKVYRVDCLESLPDSDYTLNVSEIVPPHEYLAREYARSRRTAANSVFEGVGRTLKGRDMSRVRDAVWSQTGFDG